MSTFTRKEYILSDEQREFIKTNYLFFTDDQLAKLLETTHGAIRKLRHKYGLKRRDKKKTSQFRDALPPLIIWMPRASYEEFKEEIDTLSIEEFKL